MKPLFFKNNKGKQKPLIFEPFLKNKKGMGIGQVFIFIVVAITFAVIMIFGYKAIVDFIAGGEKVEFIQFKTNIENSVQRIYSEYGAVRIEEFRTPLKFTKICFVNMDYEGPDDIGDLCDIDVVACDTLQDARAAREAAETAGEPTEGVGYNTVDENVFLTPPADVNIKVRSITINEAINGGTSDGWLCPTINSGSFKLRLEGRGDHTDIQLAPTS